MLGKPVGRQDYGLPMGYAQVDSAQVLRAQRAILVLRDGAISIPSSGEIAKAAGLVPVAARDPE